MILRLFERLCASGLPVYIAGNASFPAPIDEALRAPLLIDRRPGRGPLAALISALPLVKAERVFAIAGDQPRLGKDLLDELAAAWQPGDESIVPRHAGGIEPLAALYGRIAVLREGYALLRRGHNAMHELIARLAARFVPVDEWCFLNVNRKPDLQGLS